MSKYKKRHQDKAFQEVSKLLDNNPNLGKYRLAKLTGYDKSSCLLRKKWWKADKEDSKKEHPEKNSKWDCKGETAEAEFISDERCKTVEDVLRKGNIDGKIWDVERFVLNSWEGFYKSKDDDDHTVVPLWQVKVWLKKKTLDTFEFLEDIKKDLAKYSPKVPKFHKKLPKRGYMLEMDLFDLHIGKLAWHRETKNNWDLQIAVDSCNKAVDGLVERTSMYKFDRIVLPVGNDLLHIDNLVNETAAGTRQDCEGRAHKMFVSAYEMCCGQIDRLKHIAPVEIVIIPGNHDLMSTFHLGVALWARYEKDKNVTVDFEPIRRKYVVHGKCLIGYCHGSKDDPKINDLPLTMMTEKAQEFANAVHRHWHLGHLHKSRQKSSLWTEDSFQGVVVRIIRSLTAADYWHYNKGFIQPHARGAEAFVWNDKDGMVQHNLVYAE